MTNKNIPEESEDPLKSKTQLKKEMHERREFGLTLAQLSPLQLDQLPLSEPLRAALDEFQRLPPSFGAQKRHSQYVGKLMRHSELSALQAAVAKLEKAPSVKKQTKIAIQERIDKLLHDQSSSTGDSAIQELLEEFPQLERQKLRQLCREISRSQKTGDNSSSAVTSQGKQHAQQQKLAALQQKLADYLRLHLNDAG